MLKIHTSDGKTHKVDMLDPVQAKDWSRLMRSRDFQARITGISVVGDAGARLRCPGCNRAGHLYCRNCESEVPNESRSSVGVQYSMTKPDGYMGPALFLVERVESDTVSGIRGGERVTCFAGDARIQMMVHAGQPSMRMTVERVGRQVHSPYFE